MTYISDKGFMFRIYKQLITQYENKLFFKKKWTKEQTLHKGKIYAWSIAHEKLLEAIRHQRNAN